LENVHRNRPSYSGAGAIGINGIGRGEQMRAKNTDGKSIPHYINPMLPLMPAPKARRKAVEVEMTCGFCGGKSFAKGKPAELVNGFRIHPLHKSCLKSARIPLFNMQELLR
jgi:hypothetical protein